MEDVGGQPHRDPFARKRFQVGPIGLGGKQLFVGEGFVGVVVVDLDLAGGLQLDHHAPPGSVAELRGDLAMQHDEFADLRRRLGPRDLFVVVVIQHEGHAAGDSQREDRLQPLPAVRARHAEFAGDAVGQLGRLLLDRLLSSGLRFDCADPLFGWGGIGGRGGRLLRVQYLLIGALGLRGWRAQPEADVDSVAVPCRVLLLGVSHMMNSFSSVRRRRPTEFRYTADRQYSAFVPIVLPSSSRHRLAASHSHQATSAA